jgi:hypothetical protein
MSLLPIEIVNIICRYNSHPIADEIRILKEKFKSINFHNKVLLHNRMLVKNKLLDKKIKIKTEERQFNEKINKIYLFVNFCINSYIVLGVIACLLHLFGLEDYYVLFFVCAGYFYFYFLFLMFLIFFSLNISFQ